VRRGLRDRLDLRQRRRGNPTHPCGGPGLLCTSARRLPRRSRTPSHRRRDIARFGPCAPTPPIANGSSRAVRFDGGRPGC